MQTKKMSNMEVINAIRFMQGPIKDKKLPVELSYAIRRSIEKLNEVYNPYIETIEKLCSDYGCSVEDTSVPQGKDSDEQKALDKEIKNLLAAESDVELYTVDFSVIEKCETDTYDSLTYKDIDGLWWLIDDEKEENS